MPAFPRSVQQVVELTGDINCEPRELVRVVEHDPVLTGRMLQLVNSAYFGLSRRIESIKEAVVFIGMNTLRHMALTLAAVGALPRTNKAGLNMDQYLGHSLAVGAVSRWIATRCGWSHRDSDMLFISGLLHNIGQVVLAVHLPKSFRRVRDRAAQSGSSLHELEQEMFGTTHFEIGGQVAENWELKKSIIDAIRYHQLSPPEVERTVMMDGLRAAIEVVALLDDEPSVGPLPHTIEPLLGCPIEELLTARQSITDAIAKTQVFRNL